MATSIAARGAGMNQSEEAAYKRTALVFITTGLLGILVLAGFGIVMRANQATIVQIGDHTFYRLMTAHGLGMIAFAQMFSMASFWYLLSKEVRVSIGLMRANYWLCLLALALLFLSTLEGGFAGALTFHYPLPFHPAGQWTDASAAMFLLSQILLGVPFLLFFLDVIFSSVRAYGSLPRAIGWPVFFARFKYDANAPYVPPIVIGGTIASIIGTLAMISGGLLSGSYLVRLFAPDLAIDPLLAKNVLFFWMHNFTNVTLFLAVNVLFGIMPKVSGRPGKTLWMVPFGWHLTLVFSLFAYAHHMMMDAPNRTAMGISIMSSVSTYLGMLPGYAISIFTVCLTMFKAGVRLRPSFIFILTGTLGWGIGCLGGLIDATISVNFFLHNTLWVPGHFHTYYLFGVLLVNTGFLYVLVDEDARFERANGFLAYAFLLVGAVGLVSMFYASGLVSVPRRLSVTPDWATHLSTYATVFGTSIFIGFAIVLTDFWRFVWRSDGQDMNRLQSAATPS